MWPQLWLLLLFRAALPQPFPLPGPVVRALLLSHCILCGIKLVHELRRQVRGALFWSTLPFAGLAGYCAGVLVLQAAAPSRHGDVEVADAAMEITNGHMATYVLQ